jgi:hypothetical protein
MRNVRLIFNDDFYRLCAVVLSKKFSRLEKQLHDRYAEIGLPLPPKGFTTAQQYRMWLHKAIELENKKDTPGAMIEGILKQFNLDPKNENSRNILTSKLFFKKYPWEQTEYIQPPIRLITKEKNDFKELWVKIEPWTKKSDYVRLWGSIKNIQKNFVGLSR